MVTNMAMNYGADIVNQKKKEVEGMVEKYVSIGQLKVCVVYVSWTSLEHVILVLLCCGQLLRDEEAEVAPVPLHPLRLVGHHHVPGDF